MLMHEWLKYRDKRIKRLGDAGPSEQDEEAVAEAEAEAQAAAEAEEAAPTPAEAEEMGTPGGSRGGAISEPDRPVEAPPVAAVGQPVVRRQAAEAAEAPKSAREVLESLQPSADVRSRLEAVLARQRRLPLDEEYEEEKQGRRRRPAETREQLVGRLLDPTLTLQETALLLGVCPTTVRRYTNRGALQCFRTPGNQRRFKLADVLEFMERREQGEV